MVIILRHRVWFSSVSYDRREPDTVSLSSRGRLPDLERSFLKIDLGLNQLLIFTEKMAFRGYLPSRQVLNFFRNRNGIKNISRKFTENLREPSQPLGNKQAKWMSAEEAVRVVKSGDYAH
ncbi:hypothetical protein NPIL_192861 [Nephila pilipes]|uniref:Uncharacterized protein n=1 Tax=Nephila pilipes TaxID=299642 RepID=A0A8X6PE23_NEPPI|nr:hypothetical protein NPIL_192841 [Nephila pilipes]GFT60124.1 hypothetical protein NPIL_192861 [Nephila pilipes]